MAAELGMVDVVKFLLDAGANPKLVDEAGKKPVDLAKEKEQKEVVKLLSKLS